MSEVQSFQDLLDDFADETFVGRVDQLALFEKAITSAHPSFLILDVFGQGGVGKTTLLEQFGRIARRLGAITVSVNEDQSSVSAVLESFAHQLNESGYPFPQFRERYQTLQVLQNQIEGDPKAPRGILDFAVRSAARIGMRSLHKIPVAGDALDVLLSPETEGYVADQASAITSYIFQRFTNKDERVLLLQTNQELTKHFLIDFEVHSREKRVVIFFDTYEKTSLFLENWLLELMAGKFGSFSSNVLVVIAGRHSLGQTWTRYRKAIRQLELGPFTDDEAKDYLTRSNVTDKNEIAQLLKISGNLPVLLALLVSTPRNIPVDMSGDAVERFLQGATEDQHEAALAASVPRFLNQDILNSVLPTETARVAFEWLREVPFVRSGAKGWIYHDLVRSLMLHYLRLRSNERCVKIHSQLVEYYRTRLEDGKLTNKDKDWRAFELERLYHLLSHDTQMGLREIVTLVLSDDANATRQGCSQILSQVADEMANSDLMSWSQSMEHLRFLEHSGWDPAEPKQVIQAATLASGLQDLDAQTKGKLYDTLGRAYQFSKQYETALRHYDKSIELQPNNAASYHWRAHLYSDMENNEAALSDFNKAIELDQTDAGFVLSCRGMLHISMGDLEAAMNDFDQAVERNPMTGWNYHVRAHAYASTGDSSRAIADFTKAIELDPTDEEGFYCRGKYNQTIGQYAEALADLNKAIDLQPDNAENYHARGHVYEALENQVAALSDFTRAIELDTDDDAYYGCRGALYREMDKFEDSLVDFDKAIELAPQNPGHYHRRAHTFQEMDEYERAFGEFSKAIELDEKDWENYFCRGGLSNEMGRHVQALLDLDSACQLRPAAECYFQRGIIHFDLDDWSAAAADFSKAIELDPQDGDSYFWRGRALLEEKDIASALSDFTRAIELQPEDVANLRGRGLAYFRTDDYPKALQDFTRAVQLEPDGDSFYWLGKVLFQTGEYNQALSNFGKAIELQPDDGDNYFWRGRTHFELEDYPSALSAFSRAIESQQVEPEWYSWRAKTHLELGEDEAAAKDFQRASDADNRQIPDPME